VFKALAEFIMRGRFQAVCVVLIGSWFPLVSQATMGLVALRKGWQEGLLLTLWALLPALLGIGLGQVESAISLAPLCVFGVAYFAALVLRSSSSWSVTFGFILLMAALSGIFAAVVVPDLAKQITGFFEAMFADPEAELPAELKTAFFEWNTVAAGGLIAFWVGMTNVLGLLAARWWQALLYNPGGFQAEFWNIRLPLPLMLVCSGAWLVCLTRGDSFSFWQLLFGLPLLFAGLGLIHWLVGKFNRGVAPLVVLYIALVILPIVGVLVIVLAIADAIFNLRNKIEMNQPPQSGG
jgi:hypothetical protein